ncbi:fucose 4-O-acetylase [Vibrio sp. HA2012]|uniref:acyltransferase n=1 Tax=Vibrio sp. HA2012 TaxID=1971595 RepID=UPI000C2C453E|nr:acyltransferase family protein [Vibrio sp. HA2012]PJC88138.1 fucose 4-O-acetylase [Vibrio sp. HA2012]
MSGHSQKIASMELGRLIAMFAIILLHNQVLTHAPMINGAPWVGYVINQLARFAVPFFFILSGFLLQPKLTQDPFRTFKDYSLPLIKLWIVWSIISLLMPFNWQVLMTDGYMADRSGYWGWLLQNPLNSFLEGGLVHLWFIPGLICAVALLAVFIAFNITVFFPFVAVILYVYGLLGGSYGSLTEIWTPFFTRNGPFFSTLMVWIGFEIRRRGITCSFNTALGMATLGLLIHFSEATWLAGHEVLFNVHDFLAGTPLWGIGVFMMLLQKPHWGDHPLIYKLGGRVLGIYVAHLPVAIVFYNLVGMFGLETYVRDLVLISGTVFGTMLLMWGVEKTPLRGILLR